jgi:hypothetical protein
MDINIDVDIGNNTKEVQAALDAQIEQALIAIGMTAESYAKLPEKDGGHMPVDTGRLKNSITYAIAGQSPHITSYRADKGGESGSYGGTMPQDKGGKPRSVYVGSNVEYAAAVENGISGKQTGKHFLRSALSDHTAEYKEFIEKALKGQ